MPEAAPSPGGWWLYLLECRNGAYYAGITNRLEARYAAHLAGTGARYTRANPPVRLLAVRAYADRSAASRAEAQLKRLPRVRKLAFFGVIEVRDALPSPRLRGEGAEEPAPA